MQLWKQPCHDTDQIGRQSCLSGAVHLGIGQKEIFRRLCHILIQVKLLFKQLLPRGRRQFSAALDQIFPFHIR